MLKHGLPVVSSMLLNIGFSFLDANSALMWQFIICITTINLLVDEFQVFPDQPEKRRASKLFRAALETVCSE